MDKNDVKYLNLLWKLCMSAVKVEEYEDIYSEIPTMENRIRMVSEIIEMEKLENQLRNKYDPPESIEGIVNLGKLMIKAALKIQEIE